MASVFCGDCGHEWTRRPPRICPYCGHNVSSDPPPEDQDQETDPGAAQAVRGPNLQALLGEDQDQDQELADQELADTEPFPPIGDAVAEA